MVGERNISVSFKADGTSDTWVQKWPLRVVRIMTGEFYDPTIPLSQ
jgi:hypothetical protein